MKKLMMMAVAAGCISMPAFAGTDKMMEMTNAKMMMMDGNKDGTISKAEWDSTKDQMFSDMDSNKDGMISKEELMNGEKMMHDKMMMHNDGMAHQESGMMKKSGDVQ